MLHIPWICKHQNSHCNFLPHILVNSNLYFARRHNQHHPNASPPRAALICGRHRWWFFQEYDAGKNRVRDKLFLTFSRWICSEERNRKPFFQFFTSLHHSALHCQASSRQGRHVRRHLALLLLLSNSADGPFHRIQETFDFTLVCSFSHDIKNLNAHIDK